MQLFKRDRSPFWWAEFHLNGERFRFSTKRPLSDKAGAQRYMALEYERLMNQHQFGQKPEVTLKEAMEKTVKTVKGKTKESYQTSMNRWLGLGSFARDDHWHLDPGMNLSRLTQNHLEDHLQERQDEGLSNNSIIIEVRFIQRVCNLMRKRYNVNQELEFKKPKKFSKTRWLTPQEEATVLEKLVAEAVENPSYGKAKDLFIFLLDTGVRLGEALHIEWSNIDLTRLTMEVYRSKTDVLSILPISDRLHEVLKRLSNQKKPFMEMSRSVRLLRKVIDEVCNQNPRINAQRGKATIHTCRDTFASRLIAAGMSLKKVSFLLGHTSTAMTEKYTHIEARDVLADARRFLNG